MYGRTSVPLKLILLIVLALAMRSAPATTCPNCEAQNPDDAAYCAKCKTPLNRDVRVPSVVGMSKDDAIALLKSAKCGFRTIDSTSDAAPGEVLYQSPTGTVSTRVDKKLTVRIWVSTSFPEPRWLRKIKDWTGWPDQGKSVAGISIGDSASTVRNVLGDPVIDIGGSWYYSHEEDSLRVVFKLGQVDTIHVSMSEALRQSLTTPLDKYMLPMLAQEEPEESDSTHRMYPKDGITIFLHSDTVSGFSMYAPRKEEPWVTFVRRSWRDLRAFSHAGLCGLPPDSIRRLFGNPQREESTAMLYMNHDSRLTFRLVGGETDTVSFLPARALLDSMSFLETRAEVESAYGKPTSFRSAGGRDELVYSDTGLTVIFDYDTLISARAYYPEYHDMILIPAGRFLLGTSGSDLKEMRSRGNHPEWGKFDFGGEMPQKEVYLDSLYIDKYEVSNRRFLQFLKATHYRMQGDSSWVFRPGKENYPATGVTWTDAAEYARWVGKRLPTEMEWEKAARCTLTPPRWFPWGRTSIDAPARANYRHPDTSTVVGATVPVDSLDDGTSLYGVYNMAGNVMEWCSNPYFRDYYRTIPLTNPKGVENVRSDSLASVRGGSFQSTLYAIRSTYRSGLPKTVSQGNLGFRCVKGVRK